MARNSRDRILKRQALVRRLLAQGMASHEILDLLNKGYTQDPDKNDWMQCSAQTLRNDCKGIRAANQIQVDSMTANEMATEIMAKSREEERELWKTVRTCADDPKLQAVKVGALKALAQLRADMRDHMQKLGIVPDVPVKEELLRWIIGLNERELEAILKAKSDQEVLDLYLKGQGGLQIVRRERAN